MRKTSTPGHRTDRRRTSTLRGRDRTPRRIIAGLVALVLAALAASPAAAVPYGEPDGNQHPYVGLVVFYDKDGVARNRCSGTLLSETVFLTAGHCTDGAASA